MFREFIIYRFIRQNELEAIQFCLTVKTNITFKLITKFDPALKSGKRSKICIYKSCSVLKETKDVNSIDNIMLTSNIENIINFLYLFILQHKEMCRHIQNSKLYSLYYK